MLQWNDDELHLRAYAAARSRARLVARAGATACASAAGVPANWPSCRRLSAETLARRVAVYPSGLGGAVAAPLPSMAGELEIERDGVCFTPRFPFVAGTTYVVRRRRAERDAPASRPGDAGATGPGGGDLPDRRDTAAQPAQALRPLLLSDERGLASRAVSMRRADGGGRLEGVLLPMEPELWDRDRTRLTMLLDPGRIKRGLVAHDEAGYPLTEGGAVVVAIERSCRDAAGRPLLTGAERRYDVGAPVRAKVDPGAWRITPPPPASRERVTVRLRPAARPRPARALPDRRRRGRHRDPGPRRDRHRRAPLELRAGRAVAAGRARADRRPAARGPRRQLACPRVRPRPDPPRRQPARHPPRDGHVPLLTSHGWSAPARAPGGP